MPTKKVKKNANGPKVSLEALLKAGAHFGHESRRWNPKMSPYIWGTTGGVHIFDLIKTRKKLLEAYKVAKENAFLGKTVLFVGTKRQAQDAILKAAQKAGMPSVTERWLGGTLTNFEQIHRSIEKLNKMKKEREEGQYKTYTKRERMLLDREIARLERLVGGISGLEAPPDMLFVVDCQKEETAVAEARRKGIPVMAIVDTNTDPDWVDWPIPANDDSSRSIEYIVGVIAKGVEEGGKKRETKDVRRKTKDV